MSKVLAQFFGDESFPIRWENDTEKELHWFYDDLHCPHPISPLYADIGGWWGLTCEYMYRRFGAPFGQGWIGKVINGYVYTAVVPRTDGVEIERLAAYYNTVMPVYAEKFLTWWHERYLPEINRNNEFLDNYPYEEASIADMLIQIEDALDVQDRHFKIHWILNLAQFQAFMNFRGTYEKVLGSIDEDNVGKILVSIDDRNWDSLKALWEMKEMVKNSKELSKLFQETPAAVLEKLDSVPEGVELKEKLEEYRREYGNKAIYTHEYIYSTWREDPTHIIATVQNYIESDYNFYEAYNKCRKEQEEAIEAMFARVKNEKDREELKSVLDTALNMAPLTPDHHFYIDQGTYARMRMIFKEMGKKLTAVGTLEDAEDIFMLKYEEIRAIASNPQAFDVKALVKVRRRDMEKAKSIKPREWVGTVSEWSLYQEPYKNLWGWPEKFDAEQKEKDSPQADADVKVLKGLPASAGVVEGTARFVTSPAEFNQIQKGDILVCKMTNPAWVVSFTKISGLVTDTGGALSHPAVVSREFGIPCVVGTSKATRVIKSGMKVRVDGNKGTVEILG